MTGCVPTKILSPSVFCFIMLVLLEIGWQLAEIYLSM